MLRILEAVISIITLLTFFFGYFLAFPSIPSLESINWKLQTYNLLKTLDEKGMLRNFILQNRSTTLKNILKTYLGTKNLEVVICETQCNLPEIESEKLTSIFYLISGNSTHFSPKQILVYRW